MKVQFFLYTSKKNSRGDHPLYCRVVINGTRDQFSTGHFLQSGHWNTKLREVSATRADSELINSELNQLKIDLSTIKNVLVRQYKRLTATQIVKHYKQAATGPVTFLQMLDRFMNHQRARIRQSNGIRESTYNTYLTRQKNLVRFLCKNKMEKYTCEEIRTKFISAYEADLKSSSLVATKKGRTHNYAIRFLRLVRQVLDYAVLQEEISFNRLAPVRFKAIESKEPVYLTDEEVELLETYDFGDAKLNEIRDCYLFSCATGFGYEENQAFNAAEHVQQIGGRQWIRILRKKTSAYQRYCYIPLFARAQRIIQKYGDQLPRYRNQDINKGLHRIQEIVGLQKNLVLHSARRTAANYWYDCGVSENTIADALGNTVNVLRKNYLSKNNKFNRIAKEFAPLIEADEAK